MTTPTSTTAHVQRPASRPITSLKRAYSDDSQGGILSPPPSSPSSRAQSIQGDKIRSTKKVKRAINSGAQQLMTPPSSTGKPTSNIAGRGKDKDKRTRLPLDKKRGTGKGLGLGGLTSSPLRGVMNLPSTPGSKLSVSSEGDFAIGSSPMMMTATSYTTTPATVEIGMATATSSIPTYIIPFNPLHHLLIGRSRQPTPSHTPPPVRQSETTNIIYPTLTTADEPGSGSGSKSKSKSKIMFAPMPRSANHVSRKHISIKWIPSSSLSSSSSTTTTSSSTAIESQGQLHIQVLGQNGCRIRRSNETRSKRYTGGRVVILSSASNSSGQGKGTEAEADVEVDMFSCKVLIGWPGNGLTSLSSCVALSSSSKTTKPTSEIGSTPLQSKSSPLSITIPTHPHQQQQSYNHIRSQTPHTQQHPSSEATIPIHPPSSSPMSSPINTTNSSVVVGGRRRMPSSLPPSSPPSLPPSSDAMGEEMSSPLGSKMRLGMGSLVGVAKMDRDEEVKEGEEDQDEDEEDDKSIYSQMTEESDEEEEDTNALGSVRLGLNSASVTKVGREMKAQGIKSIPATPQQDKAKYAGSIMTMSPSVSTTATPISSSPSHKKTLSVPTNLPSASSPAPAMSVKKEHPHSAIQTNPTIAEEIPPIPKSLDLNALVATTLVFAGSSATSCPDLVKAILETQPSMKELASEFVWKSWVQSGLVSHAMFGRIDRKGKDSGGKPLLPLFFYVPAEDPDKERANQLGMLVRPMRSSQMRGGKAIDWRPVGNRKRS